MKTLVQIVVFVCLLGSAAAHQVRLSWTASADSNVTSYVLYCGTNSGHYAWSTNVNTCCQVTLTNAFAGKWFFMVTARDDVSGLESDPSNEVNVCLDCKPSAITNLSVSIVP